MSGKEANKESWIVEREALIARARALQLAVLTEREGRTTAEAEAAEFFRQLEEMTTSPAWQVISLYRRFLQWRRSLLTSKAVPPVPALGAPVKGAEPIPAQDVEAAVCADGPPHLPYTDWLVANEPGEAELEVQREVSLRLGRQPVISILVPVYQIPLEMLREMVRSVQQQTYPHWQLCLAHAAVEDQRAREWLQEAAAQEPRMTLVLLADNGGISRNTNAALQSAVGDWCVLLDHDDALPPSALYEVAASINEQPEIDFFYSDKDWLSARGDERLYPLLKPDWSPELMLSANYVTHLSIVRTPHVRAVGGFRPEADGAQDWDLFLRLVDRGLRIRRIPKILYHWRLAETSTAAGGVGAKPYAAAAQLQSVTDSLERRNVSARAVFNQSGVLQVRWEQPEKLSVSVVLVTQSAQAAERATQIAAMTDFKACELIVPIDGPAPAAAGNCRFVATPEATELATRLNMAVRASTGQCLVFLDDAVDPEQPRWLDEIVSPLQIPGVGISAPVLLDGEGDTVLQAGLVLQADGSVGYPFRGEPLHAQGIFGGVYWYRNWLAAGGACFAIRRESFDRVGGFSSKPVYPRLDVDLCLRVHAELGERLVCNPFARLRQWAAGLLEERLGAWDELSMRLNFPEGDPYLHPGIAIRHGKFILRAQERPPVSPATVFAPPPPAPARSEHKGQLRTAVWLLPAFTSADKGDLLTLLLHAEACRREYGLYHTFLVVGNVPPSAVRARIARVSATLARDCGIQVVANPHDPVYLPQTDLACATHPNLLGTLADLHGVRAKLLWLGADMPLESTCAAPAGWPALCGSQRLYDAYREAGGQAIAVRLPTAPEFFFPPARPRMPWRYLHWNSRRAAEILALASQLPGKLVTDAPPGTVQNAGCLGPLSGPLRGAFLRTAAQLVELVPPGHVSSLATESDACQCPVWPKITAATTQSFTTVSEFYELLRLQC